MKPEPRQSKPVSIQIQNLSKSFGDHLVLEDISLDIAPKSITVIMGPSGSGKSVLLKNIIGLETPSKGTILINGQDIYAQKDKKAPKPNNAIVSSMVFQAGALFNSLSVYDNLAFYPREHRLYTEKQIDDKVKQVLSSLSLSEAADKYPSSLSGGMKKRVAIARSLMMEPDLLLYDEPTSELDPMMSAKIIEIIAALRQDFGVTSIVVSHDRDLAYAIGDTIALLVEGKVHALGTKDEMRHSKEKIVKHFFKPTIHLKHPHLPKTSHDE